MPTYEYHCNNCGQDLEIFQKITDEPMTECPKCHQGGLKKLVSATNFQLKGTGWYVTDIRDKNKPKPTEDGKEKTTTKPADSSGSSDASGGGSNSTSV